MTKKKKIIMGLIFLVVIAVLVLVAVFIKNKSEKPDGDEYNIKFILEGEILELSSDGCIVVKITAERNSSELKLDEKVRIKVNAIEAWLCEDGKEDVDISDKYEMQVGDIVNASFWKGELETKDGEKYLDLEKEDRELSVYFTDFENRIFM